MRRRFVLKYDYLVIAGLETVWRRYQPHHVPRTAGADEFLHVAVPQWRRRRTTNHHLQVFADAGWGQCEGIPGRVPWISDVRWVQRLQQSTGCKEDRLLGAHMVGASVTEMLAEPTLARTLGVTAHRIARTIHAHPTMNEGVMEAAGYCLHT